MEGHAETTGSIDPVDWLPEIWTARDVPTSLSKEHRGGLQDIDGKPPLSQPPL